MVPATHEKLTHNQPMNSPRTSTNAARPGIELADMGIPAQQNPGLALPSRTVSRPKKYTYPPVLVTPRLKNGSKLDSGSTDYNPFSKNYTNPFDAGWTRPSSRPTRTQSPDALSEYTIVDEGDIGDGPTDNTSELADVESMRTPIIVDHSGDLEAAAELPPRSPRASRISRFKQRMDYNAISWTIVCLIHLGWLIAMFVISVLPKEKLESQSGTLSGEESRTLWVGFTLTCFLLGLFVEIALFFAGGIGGRTLHCQTSRARPWLGTLVVAAMAFNGLISFGACGWLS